jgi:hypothetical protein
MIARLRLCGEMIMHMLKGEVEVEVAYVIKRYGRKDVDSASCFTNQPCSCFGRDGRVLLSS